MTFIFFYFYNIGAVTFPFQFAIKSFFARVIVVTKAGPGGGIGVLSKIQALCVRRLGGAAIGSWFRRLQLAVGSAVGSPAVFFVWQLVQPEFLRSSRVQRSVELSRSTRQEHSGKSRGALLRHTFRSLLSPVRWSSLATDSRSYHGF